MQGGSNQLPCIIISVLFCHWEMQTAVLNEAVPIAKATLSEEQISACNSPMMAEQSCHRVKTGLTLNLAVFPNHPNMLLKYIRMYV